ncbi:MAG TPA: radical SAM protein [Desulfosalsimonadaceae bacterium]|nr:radical SAM protein [Desulfosalsimonadaceae bacterium]
MQKTVAFSRNAVNVFFHILTRCNLNCRHCYINPAQHGSETLTADTIEKWLGLFPGRHEKANLILLGGEPTLHPRLDQVIFAARRLGYDSITIDTNGYLFHDILDKVTPADVDFISFSLDGATAETNDRIRGRGCYETCISGIRSAVRRGFRTSLIYTVSGENIGELEMMPPLLEDLGVDRFFIQVIGIRGKSAEPGKGVLQLDRSTWMSRIPDVAEKVAASGIVVTYPRVFLDPGEVFECAGRVAANYFIFPNGRVYRCPLCEDYPLHSLVIEGDRLQQTGPVNEKDLFSLEIPEGCVMNKLVQPGNLSYSRDGRPEYKIACCLLKEEVSAHSV